MRFASIVTMIMVLASGVTMSPAAAAPLPSTNENRQLRFVGLHRLPAEQVRQRESRQPRHHRHKHSSAPSGSSSHDVDAEIGSGGSDHHSRTHHHHHHGPHKRNHVADAGASEVDSASKAYDFDDAAGSSYTPGTVQPADVDASTGDDSVANTATYNFTLLANAPHVVGVVKPAAVSVGDAEAPNAPHKKPSHAAAPR